MNLYKTTITPKSNFSSKLKADQLFGQFCWAIRYSLGEERLKELLSNYEQQPFIVFSDAFAKGFLPKPSLPSKLLNENAKEKKQNRKKIWLTLNQLQKGEFNKAKTDDEVENFDKENVVIRNSINYLTFTTGDGFDPYSKDEFSLSPKDIYFLLDEEQFNLSDFLKAFTLLSQMGYGADTTIGKGVFEFEEPKKIDIDFFSTTFMALSPFIPYGLKCKKIFYEPFVKFGRSGYDRAYTNPFKKPLIFANSGAVVVFEEKQKLQFIGKAIKNISIYKDVVHQGYTVLLPIKDIQ